jgi:hypothetical protein
MAEVTRCDQCRKIGPAPPISWYVLLRLGTGHVEAWQTHYGMLPNEIAGTFCSPACVSEYCRARQLLEELDGTGEPP